MTTAAVSGSQSVDGDKMVLPVENATTEEHEDGHLDGSRQVRQQCDQRVHAENAIVLDYVEGAERPDEQDASMMSRRTASRNFMAVTQRRTAVTDAVASDHEITAGSAWLEGSRRPPGRRPQSGQMAWVRAPARGTRRGLAHVPAYDEGTSGTSASQEGS